jgi:hypothetical protein
VGEEGSDAGEVGVAGASLLRGAAFFDGAGTAAPLWTLVAWAAVGLGLTAVGHFRDRTGTVPEWSTNQAPSPTSQPSHAH